MPRNSPPPLSLTLMLLRTIRGWTQRELARASGIPNNILSAYETGRQTLTRDRLDFLAASLGWEPEAVDVSLSCLRLLPSRGPSVKSPLGPTEAEHRGIQRTSALVAGVAADTTRAELARSFQVERARVARKEAEELWNRLMRLSSRERLVLVEGAREFQGWALCERICLESERAAAADANRALELADLALRVATRVPGEDGWKYRVRGYAWAYVANARRVANDLPGADKAFVRAWELWGSGTRSDREVLAEWRLLDLEASLRRAQRRLPEALDLLDKALACKSGEQGRILLKKAFTLEQMGESERAIEALRGATPFVDGRKDPRLLFALRFNLAVNLCHLGRQQEAAALVSEARNLAIQLGNAPDLIRVLWLDGRISAAVGDREKAMAALEHVRREFIARQMVFDAALVSLEVAVLYLEQGNTAEVQALARQMTPAFLLQGVHREAFAALHLFCEAAERESASVDLARRLVEYLRKARHEPGLKFQG